MTRSKLVQGFGINDLKFTVSRSSYTDAYGIFHKHYTDPIYGTWKHMLRRVKSESLHLKTPSYANTEVFEGWKFASVFYEWAEDKYEPGKELDKDILGDGTLYSPSTCCFVPKRVNQFLIGNTRESVYPMGVYKEHGRARFKAMIGAGRHGKTEHIGSFENMWEGHLSYCKRKLDLAAGLIDEEKLEDYIATALIAKLQKKVDEAEILYQQSLI